MANSNGMVVSLWELSQKYNTRDNCLRELVWDLDRRSALRLLTSSALFLPVRKKRSLVNRGSSRDPEIKSQNRAQIERRRALFPGSQSIS